MEAAVAAAMAGRLHFVSAPSGLLHAGATASPSSAFVPFEWESSPGTPKHHRSGSIPSGRGGDDDDAFEFGDQVVAGGSNAVTVDELLEDGKIRLLKVPPRLQQVSSNLGSGDYSPFASPRSTTATSPISRFFRRGRKEENPFDPFEKAIEETTRGREREMWLSGSFQGGRRATAKSASSPLRSVLAHSSSSTDTPNGSPGSKRRLKDFLLFRSKWRLKDFLLFRSASQGRVTGSGKRTEGGEVSVSTANYTLKRVLSRTMKKTLSPYKEELPEHRRIGSDVHGLLEGLVYGRS